ncbi:MAG: DNA repair exonuclease [Deltaproteobacteria bacterium]|nr:DNA repair exonuclease [Deltaproteobacteria bacterium]MBW2414741.1 DNA repair exonuclease [Deltaproteobacteria bacterium]
MAALMRRSALRLVHTSDIHLDADWARPQASGNGTYGSGQGRCLAAQAFERTVDRVRAEAADLFLIAGDLFDSSRVGADVVDFALGELARVPCPVVVMPGNHDCYDGDSIYRRVDLRDAGSHVSVLTAEHGETVELPDLHATVWGRAMVEHHAGYRPLEGVPERSGQYWHLGMAHGLVTDDLRSHYSSLIRPEEIAECGLDYLALGHVHVFREVSEKGTTACYSGSPAPLYAGRSHGSLAVVTLHPDHGVSATAHPIEG